MSCLGLAGHFKKFVDTCTISCVFYPNNSNVPYDVALHNIYHGTLNKTLTLRNFENKSKPSPSNLKRKMNLLLECAAYDRNPDRSSTNKFIKTNDNLKFPL